MSHCLVLLSLLLEIDRFSVLVEEVVFCGSFSNCWGLSLLLLFYTFCGFCFTICLDFREGTTYSEAFAFKWQLKNWQLPPPTL